MESHKKSILLVALYIIIGQLKFQAQNMSAYKDDRNYLYGFNDGQKIIIEYQPISTFKVGYNHIAYKNPRENLILYSQLNKKIDLGNFVSYYNTSDYLFTYKRNEFLEVVTDTVRKNLSKNTGDFQSGDSLVAFNDLLYKNFNVFYNNQVLELENNIIEDEVTNFIVKENILAYYDALGYFKIFNNGKLTTIGRPSILYDYDVGQNVVAFTNKNNETFNLFESDKVVQIAEAIPLSFKCGDEFVVYANQIDEFKIFKNGVSREICPYVPEKYLVIDKLVIYENLGRFTVYYNDKNYELENYWVRPFKADNNSLAYIDSQGWLIYFHDGVKDRITNQRVTSFSLNGNVLQYSLYTNDFPILYKGKKW